MAGISAIRVSDFTISIGIDTHLSYTDGAYANIPNVQTDLSYLGITKIRDSIPNPAGGIPAANQIAALEALAAHGIKFDLVTAPNQISVAQSIQQIENLDAAYSGAVFAVEGPNEINNNPVNYNGLAGQAAAMAFQTALYAAVKNTVTTAGITVYEFTGGISSPLTVAGTITKITNGSYTLVNGQTGFPVALPPGMSNITLTYSGPGNPGSGIFAYPGQGQKSAITYGGNGKITYSFTNTTGAPQKLYVDFIDWGQTCTLTGITVYGPGSTANLVTFDPNLSLAGQADDANIHSYPSRGRAIGPDIPKNYLTAFGSTAPGPRVITETGYSTDPNSANGVSQTVQAQQITAGLFDAYQSGVSVTYLYELLDEKSDPFNNNSQMHYGLFNYDNTPKLAAIALHNLTNILADPAAAHSIFLTGTLNYSITGGTTADHSMLLEKSTGVFDIAIWNSANAGTANTDLVSLTLGGIYQIVKVYDVITDNVTVYQNISQLPLSVGVDPLVVEVSPNTAAAKVIIAPASKNTQLNKTLAASASVSITAANRMTFMAQAAQINNTAIGPLNSVPLATLAADPFLPQLLGSNRLASVIAGSLTFPQMNDRTMGGIYNKFTVKPACDCNTAAALIKFR